MPVVSVGTAAVELCSQEDKRVSLTIRNDSANDVYLGIMGTGLGTLSATAYDYHLKANESINLNRLEDGSLTSRPVAAVASGAGSLVSYMEGFQQE